MQPALTFVHLLSASVWLGGGLSVGIVALRAELSGDPARLQRVGVEVEWFGSRVLMPAAVVVLISGLALTPLVASFGDLWVLLSLAAFATSAALALAFLGPRPGLLADLIDVHGLRSEAVREQIRRHFLYNRIEIVILLATLLLMVLKPQ